MTYLNLYVYKFACIYIYACVYIYIYTYLCAETSNTDRDERIEMSDQEYKTGNSESRSNIA